MLNNMRGSMWLAKIVTENKKKTHTKLGQLLAYG